jgi:hypothetical protein
MDPAPQPHVTSLAQLTPQELRTLWPQWFDRPVPAKIRRELLVRALAYRMQERASGGLTTATRTKLRALAEAVKHNSKWEGLARPRLTPGTQVIREWGNERHQVTVEATGFVYRGQRYRSLSEIARRITGTRWSGPLFFGVTPSIKGRGRASNGRLSV